MTRALFALVVIASLQGCTAVADPTVVCLVHVKEWTAQQRQQILAETDQLADASILLPVLYDYSTMRAEARTCDE